jgi:hypothetical protein
MDNLFVLEFATYDDHIIHFLHGPTDISKNEFQYLCDSLLEKASQLALKNNLDSFIGWDTIVDSLCVLLSDFGFQKFDAKSARYSGSGIIDRPIDAEKLGRLSPLVIEHNKKIRESL